MRQRFALKGPTALDPRAFGIFFMVEPPPENRTVDGTAIVAVRGPLSHRRDPWFDSYEALLERVQEALAQRPRALVLDLDSPGGDAQGCFEAARALRAMCEDAGVPLHAFVSGSACSAAYALACAAGQIAITPTAVVGSIGVYEMLVSQAEADATWGLAYQVVSTGQRKLDGNPHVAISQDAIAASRAAVETLGALFFGLVEETRGVPAAERGFDGAIAIGREAVAKKLADTEVRSLTQLLEMLSTPAIPQTVPQAQTQVKNMDEIKKALQAVVDDPNKTEDEKAKAKAALAALDPKPPAEDPPKEGGGDDAAATAAKALAEVHKLSAEIAKREEEAERASLLASRTDFAPELVAILQKAPLAMVRDMAANLPRTVPALAAAASVQPTLGKGQGSEGASRLAPEAKAKLDAQMGLTKQSLGVVDKGQEQLFGAPVPAKPA